MRGSYATKIDSGSLMCSDCDSVLGNDLCELKSSIKGLFTYEILFNRFVIATLTLLLLAPKALKFISLRVQLYSAFSGFYGVTIYFVFENNALIMSNASNVSLIVSTAPLFVALLNSFIDKSAILGNFFLIGFFIAMSGIAFLTFSSLSLQLNPEGDLLGLG